MQIVTDSKKVLNEIYSLIKENSHCLLVKIPMDQTAEKLNMSKEHLNLCIHYLILSEYITGDPIFNSQNNSTKEVTITAKGIDKVENALLK